MGVGTLRTRLQGLLHIGQLSGPREAALFERRRGGAVGVDAVCLDAIGVDTIGLGRGVRLGIQIAAGPVIGQSAGVVDGLGLDVRAHGQVEVVQLDAGVPDLEEMVDEADGEAGGGEDGVLRLGVFAAEGDGDAALAAGGGLEGAADGAGGEVVDGGGVAAVVGAGDDEVDGGAVGEEVEQAQLDAAGRSAVLDHDPVGLVIGGGVARSGLVPSAVVTEGGGRHVGGFQGGFDQVGFADPGPRGGGDGDGDEVAGVLEGIDEWLDVGGEAAGGRTVIVDNLGG